MRLSSIFDISQLYPSSETQRQGNMGTFNIENNALSYINSTHKDE